jgi:hypothetical protein
MVASMLCSGVTVYDPLEQYGTGIFQGHWNHGNQSLSMYAPSLHPYLI